jgi:hypothetical protein
LILSNCGIHTSPIRIIPVAPRDTQISVLRATSLACANAVHLYSIITLVRLFKTSLSTTYSRGLTMNFKLNFVEHDVSIAEDTWTALVTTGTDASLANVRATIMGVLERNGTFTVEDSNDQAVRRIETAADFEGFMQEVEMQRTQFQQEQAQ